ncbi:MAG: hypothetical protein A2469_04845 [Candidatus Magasanikbacteria bacterium RIFOXYC2_FULL_40_16]|uniref:Uncharacterized protein n=2 Tax=Candidatus Magasanikiibacteriota TaxID=1752731 RepID=A0A1F6NDL6_9BACT|nr:MAG: hypothetical protein A2373_04395 [Candidatus Magasanikbacteria bacterium RIFOXYB1_FULL_40_15]OGH89357.1 MAG: hypothetical protein A2469_04845 [Candidatus Magasanikbacteria bacterium RIFOXYC2_FULL_40_16]
MDKYTKELISRCCGEVVGLKFYLIPMIKEMSLSDEQIQDFFRLTGARKVELWIKISEFISEKKILDRKEGAMEFIKNTLKFSKNPVEEK